jgi:acyl-CoA reductase-like NAD-dependent aldehyde dehydrogenase
MHVTNPYTEIVEDIPETTDGVALYHQASSRVASWRERTVGERTQLLRKAFDQLLAQQEEFTRQIVDEVGKPRKHARFEVTRTCDEWRYMLDNAEEFLRPEKLPSAEVHFAPLGIVAVISPWNFPAMLPLRGIIPALVAGNAVIFKPSELSPRTGIMIADLFPPEVPLVLGVGGKELGAAIVTTPIAAIAFTGSTAVGKAIAKEASHSMKRLLLELGGLDAAIVRADADIPHAAAEIVRNNARNSGQVCNAIKRVLVHESVYELFVSHARQVAKSLIYGDPNDELTDVGPLVSKTQLDRVSTFLHDAVGKGAHAISMSAPSNGFFFPQTLLTNVPQSARLLHEEPFGPLLPIVPFKTDDEAIARANDTRFGLTASVWTGDREAFVRIAKELDVGMVRQNTHAAMDSGIPWGGCKESGLGRMKTKEGLREFTNIKVIA